MLPSSLKSLCKSFNINTSKDIFPFNFISGNNLNYIGEVPNIKYFNNLTITEYNEYVDRFKLWSLKEELLMNSLYGKFGMNPEMDQHIICLAKDIPDLFKKWIIVDQMPLSLDKFLVTIRNKEENYDTDNSYLNISVSIAAMITAASRIKMIDYFNIIKDNDGKIYYTDTDSIYTNKPLNKEW